MQTLKPAPAGETLVFKGRISAVDGESPSKLLIRHFKLLA